MDEIDIAISDPPEINLALFDHWLSGRPLKKNTSPVEYVSRGPKSQMMDGTSSFIKKKFF